MNRSDIEQGELPLPSRFLRTAILAAAMGASTGLCVWTLFAGDLLGPYLTKNQISAGARLAALACLGAFALVGVVLTALAVRLRGIDFAETAVRRRAPLVVVGLLPVLAREADFRGRELTFLVAVLGFSLALGRSLVVAFEAGGFARVPALFERLRTLRFRPPAVFWVVALALGYATYFSVVTIASHHNFCTSAFDLGIEDNLVWNASHGGPLFRSSPLGGSMMHGGYHQTYFAYVIAPFYLLAPRAETLLVIQALFLGAAAIPLYAFARLRIGDLAAVVLSCLYLLYGPLHGANLYDFHYQPFGVFFIFLVAYLVESRREKWLFPAVLLTLSVREDMGALLGALGAYFALSGRSPRTGLVLAAVGSAYFVALKLVIMPVFFLKGESSFAFMFKDLIPEGEKGFGGVIKTAAANPTYTLGTLLTEQKLGYLLELFVPLALVPLRKPVALVLFVPAFVFTLLSTGYPALVMTSFQYTCFWTPMVFLAAVAALEDFGRSSGSEPSRRSAWLVAMCFSLVLTSHRFGAFFQTETARGAFDPVRLARTAEDLKNEADFEALVARVPADAKIVAAEWLVSHVSNRRNAYTLRFGVLDADYLIFWLHPTKLRPDEKTVLRKALTGEAAPYGVLERRGLFVLAKRGAPTAANATVPRKFTP